MLASATAAAQVPDSFARINPPFASGGLLSVQFVAVHPIDGRRIIAGVGAVIVTSRDGGATWSDQRSLPGGLGRLFVHKGRPGVVFIQSEAGRYAPATGPVVDTPGRLYRSTDFGETWSLVHQGIDEQGPYAISPFASDPADPRHLFATRRSSRTCTDPCDIFYTLPADVSVHESLDGGFTWRSAAAGLPSELRGFAEGPSPASPARLFFATGDGLTYVSFDAARSWQVFSSVASIGRIGWVRQDPHHADRLYAWRNRGEETSSILRSDDGGTTWKVIFEFRGSSFFWRVPVLTADGARRNRLWLAGIEEGVFVSDDGGQNWRNVGFKGYVGMATPTALDIVQIARELATTPADSAHVYLVQGSLLYRGLAAPRDRVAVEYQYGDRFWVTGDGGEAASQDFRLNEAARTGQRFGFWTLDTAPAGNRPICRFQGNPEHGQTSRFITLEGSECQSLRGDSGWTLEGEREYFAMPAGPGGSCAAGLVAVTRFVNGLRNANHRYVVDSEVANEMRARGWIQEGVAFCARPLGSNE
jgi:photosystem II stability/assembly factor-like uncharacterized protein